MKKINILNVFYNLLNNLWKRSPKDQQVKSLTDVFIGTVTDIKQFADVIGTPGFEDAQPSDNLEIIYIENWQSVARKGDFQIGENVLFVCPDAKIGDTPRSKWADDLDLRRYLGKGGRVKTVKLRGVISNGITVKISKMGMPYERMVQLGDRLASALGVGHYEAPKPKCMFAKCAGLPNGVIKSDEENFQTLKEWDLHLGEKCLLTLKKDGCSGALQYDPKKNEFEYLSRSMTLDATKENHYVEALKPYEEQVKAIANHFGERVVLRGEVCGRSLNAHGANKDSEAPLGFFMYGFHFPDQRIKENNLGFLGSGRHFLDVNNILLDKGLDQIPTVPLLKYDPESKKVTIIPFEHGKRIDPLDNEAITTITMDMLRFFETNKKLGFEGTVLNFAQGSYKAKNAPYDMVAHKR